MKRKEGRERLRETERRAGEMSRRQAGPLDCVGGEVGICQPGWPAGVCTAVARQSLFLSIEM